MMEGLLLGLQNDVLVPLPAFVDQLDHHSRRTAPSCCWFIVRRFRRGPGCGSSCGAWSRSGEGSVAERCSLREGG